jgi:hypothetical protein
MHGINSQASSLDFINLILINLFFSLCPIKSENELENVQFSSNFFLFFTILTQGKELLSLWVLAALAGHDFHSLSSPALTCISYSSDDSIIQCLPHARRWSKVRVSLYFPSFPFLLSFLPAFFTFFLSLSLFFCQNKIDSGLQKLKCNK